MSFIKREMERLDGVREDVIHIAVEEEAIEYDDETDEISTMLDTEAEGRARKAVFTARKRGEIDGSLEEVKKALDEIIPPPDRY